MERIGIVRKHLRESFPPSSSVEFRWRYMGAAVAVFSRDAKFDPAPLRDT